MAKVLLIISLCVNAMLLIVIFRQEAIRVEKVSPSRSSAAVSFESKSATQSTEKYIIPSTAETLHAMYGEGDFGDADGHLLNYIRSMMSRQGPGGPHLNTKSLAHHIQAGPSRILDDLLKQRQNGFFVECGAFRGDEYSHTLFFEVERNWTGMLIEAHPEYHQDLLRKNRRALVLRACLSPKPRPGMAKFTLSGWGSGVSDFNKNVKKEDIQTIPQTDVQCFSLNSIMAAIGVRHIDFFVLDIEGPELQVLETIDWTRLSIDLFIIEYRDTNQVVKLDKLRRFFNRTGRYEEVAKLPMGATDDRALDVIFMRV